MRKSRPAVRPIKTTAGVVYVAGRMDGNSFVQNRYSRYYKRKSTALKAAKSSYN